MNSLKGQLLIAARELDTPIFARSVILMIDHDAGGAMGVILNRPSETSASELAGRVVEDDFTWDKPILYGGPVSGPFMILHELPDLADQEVIPGLFLTMDAPKAREILEQKAEPSLLVVNYSGWGPGQLEGEFEWDSWVTLPATAGHVFGPTEGDLWEAVVREVSARKLSEFFGVRAVPADPNLN